MARYGILLRCKQGIPGPDSSPHESKDYPLAIDSELHGVFLTNEDGEPKFIADNDEETQGIEQPDATVASFHSLGTSLSLEPLMDDVYVDSPPLPGLPASFAWGRVNIPATSKVAQGENRRFVYLRPGDTVVFPRQSLQVTIIACDIELPNATATADVQVKSSITEAGAGADVPVIEAGAFDGEETDDGHDLDTAVDDRQQTPALDNPESTPATSRPMESAVAVKETPSRRLSNDNPLFSTAPDKLLSPFVNDDNAALDTSTPAARAAESQEQRRRALPEPWEEHDESQYVFRDQTNGQRTYGRRSKHVSTSPKVVEVIGSQHQAVQSPQKIARVSSSKYDQSSEPMDETAAAMEVASHSRQSARVSVSQAGSAPASTSSNSKRKAPSNHGVNLVEDDADTASSPPAKKVKMGTDRLPKAFQQREDEEEVDRASHLSSSGKLKRSTRSPTGHTLDDSITAKPRRPQRHSSPSVRIPPHSSATGSATSSKPPDSRPPTTLLLSASSHVNKGKLKAFLIEQGLTVSEKIPSKRTPYACVVGNGPLHTTVKLLRSLAMNKKVITDQWLTDSLEADKLLALGDYTHEDIPHLDRSNVFAGRTLYFTMALQQSYGLAFKDVQGLATEAGATRVDYGSSARKAADMKNSAGVIFFGSASEDPMARQLVRDFGKVVYTRDMLTQSIIRGELLLDEDELKIAAGTAKMGRGR